MKDNHKFDASPNEIYYSEKNAKIIEINIDQEEPETMKKSSQIRRMVFSTKNAVRKNIDFFEEMEKNSEQKKINISVLEGGETKDHKVEGKNKDDINEFNSQRSSGQFVTGVKRSSKPLLEIKIAENNLEKVFT
jgi:di/tripeptidase